MASTSFSLPLEGETKRRGTSLGRKDPPRQLTKLFRLKCLEGVTDQHVLAEKLDGYNRRLKRKLVRKLGQVSPDRLRFVCPGCLEARIIEDEGVGRALWEILGFNLSTNPHDADTFASLRIAFGKSLGGIA